MRQVAPWGSGFPLTSQAIFLSRGLAFLTEISATQAPAALAVRARDRGLLHLSGRPDRGSFGFDRSAGRDTNIRRIAFVSKLLTRNHVVTLVAAISPYREVREEARKEIGNFVEVYVRCPLGTCMARDSKGLYKKALEGAIPYFTGISDPYEEPLEPEIVLHTDQETAEECAPKILHHLLVLGYLS
ncbi:MAG TPA: adenylyl-sulfate kinase [Candidatus Methylomirabilis sp.]|nr:adenylyl-sulfate kinase [Candidatus Methylomirabilis sp.]